MALVADEVFADYSFGADPQRVVSHAAVTETLTFTLSGLSKISALPQMKLAWLVVNGPPELLRNSLARMEIIADTYLSVSAPLALALPGLLETRRTHQPQILERVTSNLKLLEAQLAGRPASKPAGGGRGMVCHLAASLYSNGRRVGDGACPQRRRARSSGPFLRLQLGWAFGDKPVDQAGGL